MQHQNVLTEAARILGERGAEYGSPEACFTRIANIASEILMRRVSRYEVAVILMSTKLGRAGESALKDDTWIDEVNYAAFAAQFASDPDSPAAVNKYAHINQEVPRVPKSPYPPRPLNSAIDEAFNLLERDLRGGDGQ